MFTIAVICVISSKKALSVAISFVIDRRKKAPQYLRGFWGSILSVKSSPVGDSQLRQRPVAYAEPFPRGDEVRLTQPCPAQEEPRSPARERFLLDTLEL